VDDLLTLTIELADDYTYVRASGEIDRSNAGLFERRINELVRTGVTRIVDFTDVTYIDSAGLRALALTAQRGALRLVVPPGARVYRTIMVTGLGDLVTIVGAVDDADDAGPTEDAKTADG
jgi:anti-anti-sigma factor